MHCVDNITDPLSIHTSEPTREVTIQSASDHATPTNVLATDTNNLDSTALQQDAFDIPTLELAPEVQMETAASPTHQPIRGRSPEPAPLIDSAPSRFK